MGELLRHFLLPDLLEKEDWSHVRPSQRELSWLKDARPAFDGPADHGQHRTLGSAVERADRGMI